MGLFSKTKPEEEGGFAPAAATIDPKTTTTSPPTVDVFSSTAPPKGSSLTYTPSSSTSTPAKAPTPGHGSDSNSHWPVVPHTADYESRRAQMESDSKAHPQKKSSIKDTFNLSDPTEQEYYDRKFTASGNGSRYEKLSRLGMLGFPTTNALFQSAKKQ